MISINITGTQTMQRNLRTVRRNLLTDVDRAIGRAVSVPGIRRHIRVDTGRLRSSVRTRRISFGHHRFTIGGRRAFYPHMVKLKGSLGGTKLQYRRLIVGRLRREFRGIRIRF